VRPLLAAPAGAGSSPAGRQPQLVGRHRVLGSSPVLRGDQLFRVSELGLMLHTMADARMGVARRLLCEHRDREDLDGLSLGRSHLTALQRHEIYARPDY
jgi:hypothetical protein